MDEKILNSSRVALGRKEFSFEHCENTRGRFLKIQEHGDPSRFFGKPHRIIVPEDGLQSFIRAMSEVVT